MDEFRLDKSPGDAEIGGRRDGDLLCLSSVQKIRLLQTAVSLSPEMPLLRSPGLPSNRRPGDLCFEETVFHRSAVENTTYGRPPIGW